MPIDSSMKSSESSPSDPSMSFGSPVARERSGRRLGSNLSRSTMMPLSSSSTLSVSTLSHLDDSDPTGPNGSQMSKKFILFIGYSPTMASTSPPHVCAAA